MHGELRQDDQSADNQLAQRGAGLLVHYFEISGKRQPLPGSASRVLLGGRPQHSSLARFASGASAPAKRRPVLDCASFHQVNRDPKDVRESTANASIPSTTWR